MYARTRAHKHTHTHIYIYIYEMEASSFYRFLFQADHRIPIREIVKIKRKKKLKENIRGDLIVCSLFATNLPFLSSILTFSFLSSLYT